MPIQENERIQQYKSQLKLKLKELLQLKYTIQKQPHYLLEHKYKTLQQKVEKRSAALSSYFHFATKHIAHITTLQPQIKTTLQRAHTSQSPQPTLTSTSLSTIITLEEDDVEDSPFMEIPEGGHRDESVFADSEFDDMDDDESKSDIHKSERADDEDLLDEEDEKEGKEVMDMDMQLRGNEKGSEIDLKSPVENEGVKKNVVAAVEVKEEEFGGLGDGVSFGDFCNNIIVTSLPNSSNLHFLFNLISMTSCTAGIGQIQISPMVDSTEAYFSDDFDTLRSRLSSDGYLLIRNIIDIDEIDIARITILNDMSSNGFMQESLHSDAQMAISPWPSDKPGPGLLNRHDLMIHESILNVLEHPAIHTLMNELITAPTHPTPHSSAIHCLPYKWLRAVGTGLYTGPHLDRVYLPKNPHLLTCWIPIGPVSVQNGALVVAHASHRLPQFKRLRDEYGLSKLGMDGAQSGWIDTDPNRIEGMYGTGEIDWRSVDFGVGDVCVFGIDLLHVSATNVGETWRLSCDTRWYREGHPFPPF